MPRTFSSQVEIRAPRQVVWDLLADLGGIDQWTPIPKSYYVSEIKRGVGASRHCDVPGGYLKERAIAWKEGESYTLEVYEAGGLPLKKLEAEFVVRGDENSTVVSTTWHFAMKGGVLAGLLERIAGGRLRKGQRATLDGLKRMAEQRSRGAAEPAAAVSPVHPRPKTNQTARR